MPNKLERWSEEGADLGDEVALMGEKLKVSGEVKMVEGVMDEGELVTKESLV